MKENNNKFSEEDVIIRKATIDDNLEEIAELIYETDEHIYPYMFNKNIEECKTVLPPLMKKEGFIFHYDNIYIAIEKETNKIVGIVCIVDPKKEYSYDYTELINHSDSYKFIIENYILELIAETKELQIPYFSNVSVHPNYRSKGIGKLIMKYSVNKCKKNYMEILLDVLADNPAAIKAYENCGFEIENYKSPGFVVPDGIDVDEFSMRANFSKPNKR